MNKSFVAVLGTLLLGLALNQAVAQSATDNPTAKSSKAKGVKQMPFRGKIVSVDAPAKTITLSGKEKNRVFLVSDAAKIRKDGNPATLENIVAGDTVGGLARANGDDRWEIVTLNVGEKPEVDASKEVKAKAGE